MAKQAHYGIAPSINLARTKFKTKTDLETTFLHGKLIPLDMIPVIPGSTFKIDLTSYIRMSDPLVPLFGNINVGIHCFFVPWRLLWSHTEEFFGENKQNAGPQKNTYQIPQVEFSDIAAQSVADYLGFPLTGSNTSQESAANSYQANALKLRAYMLIWNEWYRHEQTMNPYLIELGDSDSDLFLGSRNGVDVPVNFKPISVCKQFDIATAATLSPQYGDPVEISLGGEADVIFKKNPDYVGIEDPDIEGDSVITGPTFRKISDGDNAGAFINLEDASDGFVENCFTVTSPDSPRYTGISLAADGVTDAIANNYAYDPAGTLKVDLSDVVMTNVRDLRFAFALQRYLEALNYGSRYFEILSNVYSVNNPDARLQRPEHIGQIHFPIQIQQVLSTAGAESGTTSKLGQAGANSVTLNRNTLAGKAFTEFGYICIMLDTKHDRVYSQGIQREDLVRDRFDIYAPQFDHVGDFAVQKREILLTDRNYQDDEAFGYQEGWYNERYRNSRVSGLLNPNAVGVIAPFSLAETFDGEIELNEDFMFEDRNNITRVLKTGENGPDYIANFHIEYTMIKPMSAHSLPGLIDHVGRL